MLQVGTSLLLTCGDLSAGKIEVSRSFGDLQFKRCGMSAVPDIQVFHLSQQDKFLLCGCDGFWSCFSPEDAVQAVAEMIEKGKPLKAVCDRLVYLVGHGAPNAKEFGMTTLFHIDSCQKVL